MEQKFKRSAQQQLPFASEQLACCSGAGSMLDRRHPVDGVAPGVLIV